MVNFNKYARTLVLIFMVQSATPAQAGWFDGLSSWFSTSENQKKTVVGMAVLGVAYFIYRCFKSKKPQRPPMTQSARRSDNDDNRWPRSSEEVSQEGGKRRAAAAARPSAEEGAGLGLPTPSHQNPAGSHLSQSGAGRLSERRPSQDRIPSQDQKEKGDLKLASQVDEKQRNERWHMLHPFDGQGWVALKGTEIEDSIEEVLAHAWRCVNDIFSATPTIAIGEIDFILGQLTALREHYTVILHRGTNPQIFIEQLTKSYDANMRDLGDPRKAYEYLGLSNEEGFKKSYSEIRTIIRKQLTQADEFKKQLLRQIDWFFRNAESKKNYDAYLQGKLESLCNTQEALIEVQDTKLNEVNKLMEDLLSYKARLQPIAKFSSADLLPQAQAKKAA